MTKIRYNFALKIGGRELKREGEYAPSGNITHEQARNMVEKLNEIWGAGSHWVPNEEELS